MNNGIPRDAAKRIVGAGWHGLIDEFYDMFPNVYIQQVKEKYGRLCLYHRGTDASMDKEIEIARRSEAMCENCGREIKQPILDRGWIYALCDSCYGNKK